MDKQHQPELVTVLLPVHNNQMTLSDCLESLLAQTYTNIEIIAIDDFSRDHSFSILRKYRRLDKRIKIFRNVKHYGLTTTLNRALKRASGKFIAFMDPKDISTKDRLKRQMQYLRENNKTVAIGTQCMFIDEQHKKLGKSEFPAEHENIYNKLINGLSMQFETVLINTYLLPKDLLYFYKHEYPVIYTDLFLKLQKYGSFANLNHCLYMRMQESQKKIESVKRFILPHIKLFIKARFTHDYRPSLTSLLPLRTK